MAKKRAELLRQFARQGLLKKTDLVPCLDRVVSECPMGPEYRAICPKALIDGCEFSDPISPHEDSGELSPEELSQLFN